MRGRPMWNDRTVQPGKEYWYKVRTGANDQTTDSDPVMVRTRGAAEARPSTPAPEATPAPERTPRPEPTARPEPEATPAPERTPRPEPTARPERTPRQETRDREEVRRPARPAARDAVTTEAVLRALNSEQRARLMRLPAAERDRQIERLIQQRRN